MRAIKLMLASLFTAVVLYSCSSTSTANNGKVYRAPDGTIYRQGSIYKDRNGNVYKNGQIVYNDGTYSRSAKRLPPGQAKKRYGGDAKDYAPGQMKKRNKNFYDQQDKNHHKHDDHKKGRKGKKSSRDHK